MSHLNQEIIECKNDYEGKVIATLLNHQKNTSSQHNILYIHGFNDYFFHDHIADFFTDNGFNFFALDLRKYGRSLLDHQTQFYCRNLDEYLEEIDESIKRILEFSNKKVFLLGHSTGATIASNYGNKGILKEKISGYIFNSPFLAFPVKKKIKRLFPLISLIAKVKPFAVSPIRRNVGELYMKKLHKDYLGEWDYDLSIKPGEIDTYQAWISAVHKTQKSIQKGDIQLEKPILILHSDKYHLPQSEEDLKINADYILKVSDMREHGIKLSNKVRFEQIPESLHDVYLSKKQVRELALNKTLNWLNAAI